MVVAPGETRSTGRLMRAGVHGRYFSISISVSTVLSDRSGAMIVLGMSPGKSDVMSGVGRVIGISGTLARQIFSQSLRSRRHLLSAKTKSMTAYMSENHPNALICSMVGLLQGLRSRHCVTGYASEHVSRLSELTFVIRCSMAVSTPSNGATGKSPFRI